MVDISSISSYFNNLVASQIQSEAEPLNRLTTQRDDLNVTRAVYSDVSTKISSLKDTINALISGKADFSLKSGRSVNVTNVASGYNVLGAVVTNTAVIGTYQIDDIVLGRQQRVRSAQQASSDQALGYSGSILLGGAADRSFEVIDNSSVSQTITSYSTNDVIAGQSELGSGQYSVQTRFNGLKYQFRLVDSNANSVSIQNAATSGTFTNDWQDIPTGTNYDTGRGLKVQFGSDAGAFQVGSGRLSYTAKGVTLQVAVTDSLNQIATNINSLNLPDGQGISATVIDRQLVLTGTTPGIGHDILAQDLGSDPDHKVLTKLGIFDGSGDYQYVLQAADKNTTFTVNGQPVTRYKSTGLTDVISGVTLNFAPDAEGKSATLNVATNWTSGKAAIDAFVSSFNEMTSYLGEKTGVTSISNADGSTSYKRGALASDSALTDLRDQLYGTIMTQSSGNYKYLSDIGITIDDSLKITVSDASKLENALNTNQSGVQALMDQVMGRLDTQLARFTGTGGYLKSELNSIDNQLKDLGTDITDMTNYLSDRQTSLSNYYAQLQEQLLQMMYAQQSWSSIYGTYSSSG